MDMEYGGTAEAPTIGVSLPTVDGVYFFGAKSAAGRRQIDPVPAPVTTDVVVPSSASFVECVPKGPTLPGDGTGAEYRRQSCTHRDVPGFKVNVYDFGVSAEVTLWDGVRIEELVSWLVDVRSYFDQLGLDYEDEFNVEVFDEAVSREGLVTLGYTTKADGDNKRTLFLNRHWSIYGVRARTAAVHAYFHHAQSRSRNPGSNLLIDRKRRSTWMTEGSALWFEERYCDECNAYHGTGNERFLEEGLTRAAGRLSSYRRFAFWKLIEARCRRLDSRYREMLNVGSTDRDGLRQFVRELGSADCDFGSHFGSDRSASLEAALAYYSYATMFKNDMDLLDVDMDEFRGSFFTLPPYAFDRTFPNRISEWLTLSSEVVHRLNGVSQVSPVGAFSFRTPEILGNLPAGKVAELTIDSDAELLVSITSANRDFRGENVIGADPHVWFSTTTTSTFLHGSGGVVDTFVTLVNPDLAKTVGVDVRFRIRDELSADTIITSHVVGASVEQRIVTIRGEVPEEARTLASDVFVTANGLTTRTGMDVDGTFAAEVVMLVGDNTIEAQAFGSGGPRDE